MIFFGVKVAGFVIKLAKCKKSAEIMARVYREIWVEFLKKNLES